MRETESSFLLLWKYKDEIKGIGFKREWAEAKWESERRASQCLDTDLNRIRGLAGRRKRICARRSTLLAISTAAGEVERHNGWADNRMDLLSLVTSNVNDGEVSSVDEGILKVVEGWQEDETQVCQLLLTKGVSHLSCSIHSI
ncbi:hypothetical protein RHSIM_Rhsim11G0068700 [Rhododendron simsii]|uniref:F-box protein Hrt3/FBXO9 C-terminal domain-containing protein n=1 Tax=Rhododendron simsii TaxID=118357 RepID=A0A834LBC3_RHOSS|nr:hypothetical protein RHSIM_Rhsim11G0068700 [Rhododendron simsii]